ncbi:MAG: acylphosphatase [Termitinemataceae bacterium]|nr:MAG: acylphosphatase [Termitinemataceae bacterium]
MDNTAFDATVFGVVQGVGFRYYTKDEASSLNISGWVRNNDDGTVEVHAEGAEQNLKMFLKWLQNGPSHARVDKVTCTWLPPSGLFKRFAVDY